MQARYFFQQLICGVSYCHYMVRNIIERFSVPLTNKTTIYSFKNKNTCIPCVLSLEETLVVVNEKGVLDVSPYMCVIVSHNSF